MQVGHIAGVALLAGAVRQAGPALRIVDPPVDHQARLLERAAEEAVDGLLSALRVLHKCGSGLLAAARH